MATNQIQMPYNLRQNGTANRPTNGLWYPKVAHLSTLSLRGLSDHIAEHGTVYTPDVVYGVLKKFTNCVIELVKQGHGVKLDGLGKFYPTIQAKGATSPFGYNANDYVTGIHIRFRPEGVASDNITSVAFKDRVVLRQNMIFDKYGVPKKIKNGELVDYGEDEDEGDGNNG